MHSLRRNFQNTSTVGHGYIRAAILKSNTKIDRILLQKCVKRMRSVFYKVVAL